MGKWSEGNSSSANETKWIQMASQIDGSPWWPYESQWRVQWFWVPKFAKFPKCSGKYLEVENCDTLQGINISHLGKRRIIFKSALLGDLWLVPWTLSICWKQVNWLLPQRELYMVSALKRLQFQYHQLKSSHCNSMVGDGWGNKTKENIWNKTKQQR